MATPPKPQGYRPRGARKYDPVDLKFETRPSKALFRRIDGEWAAAAREPAVKTSPMFRSLLSAFEDGKDEVLRTEAGRPSLKKYDRIEAERLGLRLRTRQAYEEQAPRPSGSYKSTRFKLVYFAWLERVDEAAPSPAEVELEAEKAERSKRFLSARLIPRPSN